jgi:hypothetical protein
MHRDEICGTVDESSACTGITASPHTARAGLMRHRQRGEAVNLNPWYRWRMVRTRLFLPPPAYDSH